MQSSDARNLFQSEASLAQGRARAAKARRTARGAEYGRPIWLGGNDGTGASTSTAVCLSDENASSSGSGSRSDEAGQLASAMLSASDDSQPFVSLAGKDENAGAAFDGGKTRVLSAVLDPTPDGKSAHLFTAESGALIRRLDLESGLAVQVFRGHTAPLMALAVLDLSQTEANAQARRRILFSAGWDKSIRAWPLYDGDKLPVKITTPLLVLPDAASDFIKALLVVPSPSIPVILSGGSDRKIRIWSLASLSKAVQALDEATWSDPALASRAIKDARDENGSSIALELLGTFGEHTRPVTALALLPPNPDGELSSSTIFSADSLGRIAQSDLQLHSTSAVKTGRTQARLIPVRELKGNDASVGALQVGWVRTEVEPEPGSDAEAETSYAWEARLWSSSRDRSAHAYTVVDAPVRRPRGPRVEQTAAQTGAASSRASLQFGSQEPLLPEVSITHPDYVTAALDLDFAQADPRSTTSTLRSPADSFRVQALGDPYNVPTLLTACSDEQVRVWVPDFDGGTAAQLASERSNAKVFDVRGNAVTDRQRSGGARLTGAVESHWHEISSLGVWWRQTDAAAAAGSKTGEWWLVSASYDGSVRRWSLEEFVKLARDSQTKTTAGVVATPANSQQPTPSTASKPSAGGVQLTAEEEAELAELMDSDDDS